MKTLSYSAMHFVVAVAVTFALTKSAAAALSVGLVEPLVQTVAYHLHERVWSKTARRDTASVARGLTPRLDPAGRA